MAAPRVMTAIVTGGASGLGRATALRLAGRGMGVVVADIQNETPFEHDNIRYTEADVSYPSAFIELYKYCTLFYSSSITRINLVPFPEVHHFAPPQD